MKWFIGILALQGMVFGGIGDLRSLDQTFINDTLLGRGAIFDIMMNNLDAIKCVDGHKVYLKPDRIVPSDEGLMLLADDSSLILLPKLYSDQYGCYIRSSLMCTSCGNQTPESVILCPHCGVN